MKKPAVAFLASLSLCTFSAPASVFAAEVVANEPSFQLEHVIRNERTSSGATYISRPSAVSSADGKSMFLQTTPRPEVIDTTSWKVLHRFTGVDGGSDPAYPVTLSPSGERILFGGMGCVLRDATTFEAVPGGPCVEATAENSYRQFISGAWSPDGLYFALADWSEVIVYDAITLKPLSQFGYGQTYDRLSLVFLPDGKSLLVTSWLKGAEIHAIDDGTLMGRLEAPAGHHGYLKLDVSALSPSGELIASGGSDGDQSFICLYDAKTHAMLREIATGGTGDEMRLAFTPDGQMIASVDWGFAPRVRFHSVATGVEVGSFNPYPELGDNERKDPASLTFSTDGNRLFIGRTFDMTVWKRK